MSVRDAALLQILQNLGPHAQHAFGEAFRIRTVKLSVLSVVVRPMKSLREYAKCINPHSSQLLQGVSNIRAVTVAGAGDRQVYDTLTRRVCASTNTERLGVGVDRLLGE